MPEYDYLCEQCGPFSEVRPMAMYAAPQPCPGCGAAAPRALLTMPALGMMDAGRRVAHATNERSAHAPAVSSRTGRHPAGCGCCSGSRTAASGAVKGFPGTRPWMISH
jgi:putative FmdB family regulatory protein